MHEFHGWEWGQFLIWVEIWWGFGGCCGHLTLLLKGIFPNLEIFFKLFSLNRSIGDESSKALSKREKKKKRSQISPHKINVCIFLKEQENFVTLERKLPAEALKMKYWK